MFIFFFQIEDPFRCSQLGLEVLVEWMVREMADEGSLSPPPGSHIAALFFPLKVEDNAEPALFLLRQNL
jgi:hypothetical protein